MRDDQAHLSYSQINMFLRCPRQYEYRYMQGLRIPPAGAMLLGKAWHRALEHNYRQKIESREDRPVDEMKEYFAYRFDEALADEEVTFEPDEGPGVLKDQGVAITEIHHVEIAPKVQPATVEECFTVSLGEEFPYDLTGIFDVVDVNGVVIDNKSYTKTPSQEDADKDLQLSVYSLGYRMQKKAQEKGLRLDVAIKTKKPKTVQIETKRTNEQARWLLRLIEQVAGAIETGVFYPNPNGWHCSPRFCGYWSRCRERRS